jgi:hypothetical protein
LLIWRRTLTRLSQCQAYRTGFSKQARGNITRRAQDTVRAHHWQCIPVVLLATEVLVASCAPQATAMASPSPSVSPAPSSTATLEPATRTQPLVTPTQSTIPIAPATATIELAVPTQAATPERAAPAAGTGGPGQKINLDEIAPPGRERDLVVLNCGTCHSFICAFRGQRTVEHWQTVKQDMRDKVSQLSDQDYDALFAYLETNFNDQKPEPDLPPELQQLGCSSGVR